MKYEYIINLSNYVKDYYGTHSNRAKCIKKYYFVVKGERLEGLSALSEASPLETLP